MGIRLETEVAKATANGWVPVLITHNVAILHGPRQRASHGLHALMTLLTAGLWILVWVPVALSTGGRQVMTLTETETEVLWDIRRTKA